MSMRKIQALVLMVWVSAFAAEAVADVPTVVFLLHQNESSRLRLISRSFHFEWVILHSADTHDVPSEQRTGEVAYSGARQFIEINFTASTTSIKDPPNTAPVPMKITKFVVVNDSYSATWMKGMSVVEQFDHESIGRMRAQAVEKADVMPNVLTIGFGIGETATLPEVRKLLASIETWSVTQRFSPEKSVLYDIDCFRSKPGMAQRHTATYTLDADEGFLVTHYVIYAPNGKAGLEGDVKATKLDGIWVPEEFMRKVYAAWVSENSDVNTISTQYTFKMTDIAVNKVIPDDIFTTSSFHCPEGWPMARQSVDGVDEGPFVMHAGVFIPQMIATNLPASSRPSLNESGNVRPLATQPPVIEKSFVGRIFRSIVLIAATLFSLLIIYGILRKYGPRHL